MNKSGYKKKLILIWIAVAVALFYFVPNAGGPAWWPVQQKLNFGLDIQGGLHLVMGIDMRGAVRDAATREVTALQTDLRDEGIAFQSLTLGEGANGEFIFTTDSLAQSEALERYLDRNYGTQLLLMNKTDTQLSYQFLDAYLLDFKSRVVQQAIETIRNRIDEFGVAEPSIVAQGDDRILIQLPGMGDAESAKALIQTAAKLDFMLVDDEVAPDQINTWIAEAETAGEYSLGSMKYSEYVTRLNEDLKSKIPKGAMVLFEKSGNAASMEAGRIPYLLTAVGLDGSSLDDARVSFNQFGAPEVSLRFNASGAQKFKELTGQNVGRRMAVVLDRVVKTAPNIQTEIGNGQAVITLGSSTDRKVMMDEAKMIATSLRAGALPATLEQLEERRIGPSLGADSLKKAEIAAVVGAIGVLALMAIRYRSLGMIAGAALVLNLGLVIAVLSLLKATLTLPGIAGIALTVGVAVDANVLIFERIREELRKGVGFAMAIREGYGKALSAILDANVVVAATSLVLLYFGTGPVRGFAVTLLTGIATTLFCQVFVTKAVVDWLLEGRKATKLSV